MKSVSARIAMAFALALIACSCAAPAAKPVPSAGADAVSAATPAQPPAETAPVSPGPQPREWVAPAVDMNPPPGPRWTAEWKKGRPLPVPLAGLRAVSAGKRIYVLGGITGKDALGVREVLVTTVEKGGKLSPWRKLVPLPAPAALGSAVMAQGRIYYLGGSSRDGMQNIYNTAWSAKVRKDGTLESWRNEAELPTRLMNHAAAERNGTLYVLGGFNGQDYTASVFYASIGADGRLSEWRTSSTKYPHRVGREGLVPVGGSLLALGGVWSDSQGVHSSSLVMRAAFSPDGDVTGWEDEGVKVYSYPLRFSLGEQATALDANYVYMFGGSNSDGSGIPTTQAAWINPRTGKLTGWQAGPDLPIWQKSGQVLKARAYNSAAAVANDTAVVMGGYLFVREVVDTVWVMPLSSYADPAWLKKRPE
jgi:N-acetylneuraminic acid mutarotase